MLSDTKCCSLTFILTNRAIHSLPTFETKALPISLHSIQTFAMFTVTFCQTKTIVLNRFVQKCLQNAHWKTVEKKIALRCYLTCSLFHISQVHTSRRPFHGSPLYRDNPRCRTAHPGIDRCWSTSYPQCQDIWSNHARSILGSRSGPGRKVIMRSDLVYS